MNLGDHVGDSPDSVEANRAALQQATQTRSVFLKQVHGAEVLTLNAATPDGLVADACITTQQRLACTIMVADCLPVLLTDSEGLVVAAAHAGWRGLAGKSVSPDSTQKGVLETVLSAFKDSFSAIDQSIRARAAPEIIAWLGPCIGPKAFQVGADVKAAFEATQADAARFFVANGGGKYWADLSGLARQRLRALGVTQVYGNDGSDAWCTVANPATYFSHRRDGGVAGNGFATTGRMAVCIWRQ
jgi:YfiH family protein